MIINHTFKFIFIHIPKNAGTSATDALAALSNWHDLEIGGTELGRSHENTYWKRFGLKKHSTSTEVRQVIGDEVWSAYFKFAFIRHPIERVQSVYNFLRKWRNWPNSEQIDGFHDIDAFIQSQFFQEWGPSHLFRPQTHWLNEPLNELFRAEHLNEEIKRLSHTLNLPKHLEVKKLNKSDGERYPLSDKSMEVLKRRWSDDFRLFTTP